MRRITAIVMTLFLTACTPTEMAALLDGNAKGDWETGGTCAIEESGWTLAWDESKNRMDLGFWLIGDCEVDD